MRIVAAWGVCLLLLLTQANAKKAAAAVPLRIVVFDAGSSGTRAHLFNLRATQESEDVMHRRVLNVNPGLSSFHDKPERAGPYLEPLIRSALEAIPLDERAHTFLFVLATAGMRTLSTEVQTALYDAVFTYFHDTPAGQRAIGDSKMERDFLGTITGQEEGFYGMLAVNFLMGRIEAIGQMDRQMRGIHIAGMFLLRLLHDLFV
jgi:Golgi nucleoside diphosphatase